MFTYHTHLMKKLKVNKIKIYMHLIKNLIGFEF